MLTNLFAIQNKRFDELELDSFGARFYDVILTLNLDGEVGVDFWVAPFAF